MDLNKIATLCRRTSGVANMNLEKIAILLTKPKSKVKTETITRTFVKLSDGRNSVEIDPTLDQILYSGSDPSVIEMQGDDDIRKLIDLVDSGKIDFIDLDEATDSDIDSFGLSTMDDFVEFIESSII